MPVTIFIFKIQHSEYRMSYQWLEPPYKLYENMLNWPDQCSMIDSFIRANKDVKLFDYSLQKRYQDGLGSGGDVGYNIIDEIPQRKLELDCPKYYHDKTDWEKRHFIRVNIQDHYHGLHNWYGTLDEYLISKGMCNFSRDESEHLNRLNEEYYRYESGGFGAESSKFRWDLYIEYRDGLIEKYKDTEYEIK